MARKPTGQVIAPKGRQRSWAIRFRANRQRQYETLGRPEDGWNEPRAQEALANVLADVRRGIWQPDRPQEPEPPKVEPTFHEFATSWLRNREPELAAKTVQGYRWALELHLLPVFAGDRLSEITVERVDRYKSAKAGEGRIGPAQVNKTLKVLAQILDVAEEYGHIERDRRNPARGRRRRLREPKVRRSWIEPEQLPSLLDVADERMRPLLATLAGAGLRVGEALALRWRDVNLATGTIQVGAAKTDAGTDRRIDMPGGLVDELSEWRARSPRTRPGDPVFLNRRGVEQTIRNVEARIKTAVRAANTRLEELGIEPLSERVTPHALRRTYASMRFALADNPVTVAEQLGHTEATFSMQVYAKAVKRRERLSGAYLREYDRALEWAGMGREPDSDATLSESVESSGLPQQASQSRVLHSGPGSSVG
jgi:integrase